MMMMVTRKITLSAVATTEITIITVKSTCEEDEIKKTCVTFRRPRARARARVCACVRA